MINVKNFKLIIISLKFLIENKNVFEINSEMSSVIEENEEMETGGTYTVCNHSSTPLTIVVPPPQSFYDNSIGTKRIHIKEDLQNLSVDSGTSSQNQSKILCSFKHNHIIPQKVWINDSFQTRFPIDWKK